MPARRSYESQGEERERESLLTIKKWRRRRRRRSSQSLTTLFIGHY
jgi:hypothetical protein